MGLRRLSPMLICLAIAGCQAEKKSPVIEVGGQLLVEGKPAAHASIALHPISDSGSMIQRSVGITQQDGSFKLTTFSVDDGAPAGEYIVTIIWPDESVPIDECECVDPTEHDRLFGVYADPVKSKLRATIDQHRHSLNLQASIDSEASASHTRLIELKRKREALRADNPLAN